MFEILFLGILIIAGCFGYLCCWYYFFQACSGKFAKSFGTSVGLLLGVIVPALGAVVGLWCFFTLPSSKEVMAHLESMFDPDNPEQVVDLIDRWANSCVLTSNSEWLKKNWHQLDDSQKKSWVRERFFFLKETLPRVNDASGFLNAVQDADKGFTRSRNKVA